MSNTTYAFPGLGGQAGMTLREYYAGLALQGVLANSSTSNETYETYDEIAQDAVSIADALIAALKEPV